VVYVPEALTELVAAHVAGHRPGDDPDRWLFGDGTRPVPPGTVGPMWRTARIKAGCDGMHLHHLRHFFASGLIAAGCDVVTLQRALGHFERDRDARHVLASVAVSRGPDALGSGRADSRNSGVCGLPADYRGGVTR